MDKKSFSAYAKDLFAYAGSIGAAPRALLDAIVTRISPEYSLIGLVDIGTEGAIIAAYNNIQEKIVLKIANPYFLENIQHKHFVTGFLKLEKQNDNAFKKRFIAGAKLQKYLYQSIQKDTNNCLLVPAVNKLSLEPGLLVEMEFIDGVNVLRWITDVKKLRYASNLFLTVLEAINLVHSYGVVHRDIKSENMLIAGTKEDPRIAVVDWSMAKIAGQDRNITLPGVRMGTSPYASAKLIIDGDSGEAHYGDDVFSLGVVMWEFWNLERVPRPHNPELLISNHDTLRQYLFSLARKLPDEVKIVFEKATSLDEDLRYQTIEPFLLEYRAVLEKMDMIENRGSWQPESDSARIEKLEKQVRSLEKIILEMGKLWQV